MAQNLAALVGSRICHDLISPIGAISNGFELLSLTSETPTEEMNLIGDSVASASARVRFFRLSYGAAAPGQTIGSSEIKSLLAEISQGNRYSYNWDSQQTLERVDVRIAFLLIQSVETALPLGGEIHVRQDGSRWLITTTSHDISFDQSLWLSINEAHSQMTFTATNIQFALIPLALSDAKRTLAFDHQDTLLTLRF